MLAFLRLIRKRDFVQAVENPGTFRIFLASRLWIRGRAFQLAVILKIQI